MTSDTVAALIFFGIMFGLAMVIRKGNNTEE